MEKTNKEMFKLYELRDSMKKTSEDVVAKIEDERLMIEVINADDRLKDTELCKELTKQLKSDIDQRLLAKKKFDEKLSALGNVLDRYESADIETGMMIDDMVGYILTVLVGKE